MRHLKKINPLNSMESLVMTSSQAGGRHRSKSRSTGSPMCLGPVKHHSHHTYPKISTQHYNQQHNNQHQKQQPPRQRSSLVALVRSRTALDRSSSFSGRKENSSPALSTRSSKKHIMALLASSTSVDVKKQDFPSADVTVVKSASAGVRLNGKISREALAAWSGRVGSPCRRAPADTVQPLFNDLHLYPSKTLVFEMLVCARQCASRGGLSLSFGEFCVFAAELRRRARCRNLASKSKEGSNSSSTEASQQNLPACKTSVKTIENGSVTDPPPYEVFLGGSCNPTTWRLDVAIPMLEKMGITYYNPQVAEWSSELIDIEFKAKQTARVLFFVLDAETRAAAAAVEAAYLAASTRSHLILVLQPYRRGQQIGGEPVPDQEYLDLSRGQAILQEVAERRELPVFNELEAALQCTQLLLRGGGLEKSAAFPGNAPPAPAIANHLMKLKRAFDAADEMKKGSLTLSETINAIKSFCGVSVSIETLENIIAAHRSTKSNADPLCYSKSPSNLDSIFTYSSNNETKSNVVDYETFCTIMAEINADSSCSGEFTMSPTNLRDLEKQITLLMKLESGTLDVNSFSSSCSLSEQLEGSAVQNGSRLHLTNEQAEVLSTATVSPQCNSVPSRWREATGKWRQLFNCVQTAILGFMSRIDANSLRFDNAQYNNQRPNISKSPSGSSVTYSRKKEQETNFKSKYRESMDTESQTEEIAKPDENTSNNTVNGNGKSTATRKLSVIIPQPSLDSNTGYIDNTTSPVLTPQSSRRLDGLAESVRDEVAVRDVYLGGASTANWRDDVVVPILKKRHLSYYKPAMNDYNRMFSAPPYTPASGSIFSFDGVSLRKHNNGDNHNDSNNSSPSNHKLNRNVAKSDSLSDVKEDESMNFTSQSMTDKHASHSISSSKYRSILNRSSNQDLDNVRQEGSRVYPKHERLPISGDHPEKKPKITSRDESPVKIQNVDVNDDDEDIELRRKDISSNGYPLQTSSSNRLSASDFYKISESTSPAPFRGMFDERQLWSSRVLFFGVTSDTRCLSPMVLAAHCIGLRPRSVVLCVQLLQHTEGLTEQAIKDYNRGRMYLNDLARREGVPVYDNLEDAIKKVIQKLETKDY